MKLQMAREGTGFWGDGVELSWAQGRAPEVIEVDDDQAKWPYRLRQRFMNGTIVATSADVSVKEPAPQFPNRLMKGGSPEAIAHMAIPAPPIIRARAITTEETLGAPAPEEPTGYAAMSVKELRVVLKDRDLPQTGKKADIVARLDAWDAEHSEPEAEPEPEPEAPAGDES